MVIAGIAACVGAFHVPVAELPGIVWRGLTGQAQTSPAATILFGIRGPRILVAALIGAGLSASGASYQALFRNPLVSPDILGVSSGAAMGAVLGIYLSLPVVAIELCAFAGGLIAVGAVWLIASLIRDRDPVLVLVLGGIVIGSLFASGVALVKFLADPYNQLPAITFWLLGSLSAVNRGEMWSLILPVAVGLIPLVLLRWRIDVMTLGEDEARALGVDTRVVRVTVVACATLMTAAAVAIGGVIGWVGLVVPHLARLAVGPAAARLLPVACLFGAAYLLAVDTLARTLAGIEIPLGVLTAILGTPLFLYLLAFGKRSQ